jgi:activator of HSP90 ATPase
MFPWLEFIEGTLEISVNCFRSVPAHTRRQAMAAFATSLGALAAGPLTRVQAQAPAEQEPAMTEKPSSVANTARTAIHYEIDFKASPQRFYQAILDQKQFAAFTGLAATINPIPGGAFSQFGGLIVGRNIELVANQRIGQAWRPTHWDAGIYSIVHFELKPRGDELTLLFDHTGFPAGEYDHLDFGWHSHYWDPLKKFLA